MHKLLQMSEESRAVFVALKEREAPKLAQRFNPRDSNDRHPLIGALIGSRNSAKGK